ncbi:MAG: hypothetical protein WBZ36_23990 [Candidatus Nitrosopolaris sp.]
MVTNHQTQSSLEETYRVAPLGGIAVSYASNDSSYLSVLLFYVVEMILRFKD